MTITQQNSDQSTFVEKAYHYEALGNVIKELDALGLENPLNMRMTRLTTYIPSHMQTAKLSHNVFNLLEKDLQFAEECLDTLLENDNVVVKTKVALY